MKYFITTADVPPIEVTATKDEVVAYYGDDKLVASLKRDGDDFIYTINEFGTTKSVKLDGSMVFRLPELIAIMNQENGNMYSPVHILKGELVTTLFGD